MSSAPRGSSGAATRSTLAAAAITCAFAIGAYSGGRTIILSALVGTTAWASVASPAITS